MNSEKDLNAQSWTYIQETGELQQDGKPVATGYSGAGSGNAYGAVFSSPTRASPSERYPTDLT